MALLESGKRRCWLSSDSLVGRHPAAAVQLEHESVSWRHASVRWTGQIWELQDLGSTNGTFVNGQRVPGGMRCPLRLGQQLRFGDAPEVWQVASVSAPMTCVVATETGERIFATDDLIALPSPLEPELFITQQANGEWLAESGEKLWALNAMEVLTLAGKHYRFEPSAPVSATLAGKADQLRPSTLALEFEVSRDEEFATVTIVQGVHRIELRPRAHTYLLLTLARLRLTDQSNDGLAPSSHGWVDQERLLKMLNTCATQLAVDIYRARKQFSEAGVADAGQLIERRTTTRELRIGVPRLHVSST